MEKMTKLEALWAEKAKTLGKTIVLPEAGFSERVVKAGLRVAEEKIAKVILLVKGDEDLKGYSVVENEYLRVVNITTHECKDMLASALYEKRKEKGLDLEGAKKLLENPVYFGTMMVELSMADGLVAGAEIATSETFRPALQIIKGKTKETKISSYFIMVREIDGKEETYVLSDCGMNIDPTAEELAEIAIQSANSAREIAMFEEPRVALLSYSTKGSADGDHAIKVRDAKAILDGKNVDFVYDGEMQLDCAIVPEVSKLKAPNSPIEGRANVLVFPNLSAGNIGYKIMQRFGGFKAFGPIAQGIRKPINDVSRGATVNDIVQAITITVLQD